MRLDREISSLIQEYGHPVTIRRKEAGEMVEVAATAMLQWVKGSGEQYAPSSLSMGNQQKILYLGEAGQELSAPLDEVVWQERRFRVLSAHPVLSGSHIAYWRGILKEKDVVCHE